MVPKIQSGPIDIPSLFPQNARDVKRLVAQVERLVRRDISRVIHRRSGRRNFEDTILPVDRVVARVSSVAAIFELMMLTHQDSSVREAAGEGLVAVKGLLLNVIGTNRELYAAVKEYAASEAHAADLLTSEQERYLIDMLKDFEKNGLGLSDEQLAKVRALSQQMMELEAQFERNVVADIKTIAVDRDGLAGLDEIFVASLKQDDAGKYLLRVDMPTAPMVMQYCAVSATREAFWVAYNNRAYPANIAVLEGLIALRDKQAKLLGFPSYAHLTIDGQMAKTPEKVEAFLTELAERSRRKYDQEQQLFRNELPAGVVLSSEGLFKPWDIAYVIELAKRKRFDVDMQKVREYFPVKRTLDELLAIYEQFLGLEFRQEATPGLWHEEVTHLVVYKKGGELLGHLLLDLYPRDNKYTHACQVTLVPAVLDEKGGRSQAVIAIVANFPRPVGDDPGLLQLQEVSTFFHEFGHAMHSLLGATRMAGFSGATGVKIDFVEVPSQMFEEWLNEPSVLRQVSCHYKTGEPLSDQVIDRICESRTFCSGAFVQMQLGYAQLALGCFAPGEKKDLEGMKKALHKEFSRGILYDDRSHSICAFGHLTQYGARYYSYLWSKVYADDLFAAIRVRGLLDAATGHRLIETVLGRGGACDPMELLRDFLGREPNMDAFLQRLHL